MTLEEARKQIDEIDSQLMELFERRMNVVSEVALYKYENNLPIFHPEREKEVIMKNVNRLDNKDLREYAQNFLQGMMDVSKAYQHDYVDSKKKNTN